MREALSTPALALGKVGAVTRPGADAKLSPVPADSAAKVPDHPRHRSDRSAGRSSAGLPGFVGRCRAVVWLGLAIPRAGVLLALPALVQSGVFECAQQVYGSLGPAFYGLRTSLLTLLLMALWRIKRPEGLKEHSPQDLGRVLGLDRAPEVKTLRRKLARLAAAQTGRSIRPGAGPATGRLARSRPGLPLCGRPRAGLPRPAHACPRPTWRACAFRCPPPPITGSTIAPAIRCSSSPPRPTPAWCKMLPGILEQVRALLGERRLTVVFDRGGFSFKLFQQILDAEFDLLTYRKAPFRRVAPPLLPPPPHSSATDGPSPMCWPTRRCVCTRQAAAAAGHPPDRRRASNADPDLPAGSGRRPRWPIECLIAGGKKIFSNTCRGIRPGCVGRIRRRARRSRPRGAQSGLGGGGRPTPPSSCPPGSAPSRIWPGGVCQPGTAAPDHARVQNRARKTGPENLQAWQRVQQLEKHRAAVPRRVPVQSITEDPVVKLAPERKHLTNLIKALLGVVWVNFEGQRASQSL